MKFLVKMVDKFLEYLLIILMGSMVLNVVWQVITRFLLSKPSTFTDELARYLLIWLGLLGASYVSGKQRHLAIDYFQNRLNDRNRNRLQLVIQFIIFFFALIIMVIGGINLVSHSFFLNQTSAALEINLGFIYLSLPLSGLLIMFYSIENAITIVKNSKQNQ